SRPARRPDPAAPVAWSRHCYGQRGGAAITSVQVFRQGDGRVKTKGGMRYAAQLLLASALLAAAAVLASVVQPGVQYVPIWPATALGLALIWRHGERYAPAIFIANFINALFSGVSAIVLGIGFASLETLIALIGLV